MTLLRMLAFAPAAEDARRRVRAAAQRVPRRAPRAPRPARGTRVARPPAARGIRVAACRDAGDGIIATAAVDGACGSDAIRRRPQRRNRRLHRLRALDPVAGRRRRARTSAAADGRAVAGIRRRAAVDRFAAQLAAQTEWRGVDGNTLTLALPVAHKHLADKAYADKLKAALEKACGRRLLLAFEVGAAAEGSLASQREREREEARVRTEAAFKDEPFVRDVVSRFDATIKSDTIKRIP